MNWFKSLFTGGKIKLYSYQKQVYHKLKKQKGILVMFGVGMGKTLAACNAAYKMLNTKKVDKVFFIMPANLINTNQFRNVFENYIKELNSSLDESQYAFYSYKKFYKKKFEIIDFKNSLIVVDEADVMANAFNQINKNKGKKDRWAWKSTWACYHAKVLYY